MQNTQSSKGESVDKFSEEERRNLVGFFDTLLQVDRRINPERYITAQQMKMLITKTDFLDYSFCKDNLWLKKNKPELFKDFELSDFDKKIVEEGNAADEEARNLYPKGVLVKSIERKAVEETKKLIRNKQSTIFQGAFLVDGFNIRADIIIYDQAKEGWELYEVKAANQVKKREPASHISDLVFQKRVIEKSGLKVVKIGVIHLNKDYQKKGKIDYDKLFVKADITDEVKEAENSVENTMEEMKGYLSLPEPKGCDCIYRGRSNHCSSFQYLNPDVPEYSIHDLYRIGISKKKLASWVDDKRYKLEEVADEDLNDRQQLQVQTYLNKTIHINKDEINKIISNLKYPLYFFDYEALICAIPLFDNFSPFEHVPFQYSLHVYKEDGDIEHKEFIIDSIKKDITKSLVEKLRNDVERKGTFVSWHASYEKCRNKKLAELHPQYSIFLEEINDNMFDLEKVFLNNLYSHADFRGKTSIKNILPVLVPELSYKSLNIQKGDQASERWEYMIINNIPAKEKEQIIKDLLEYCKLDTLAMVKIFQLLQGL